MTHAAARTRSAIGRASRNKGHRGERDLANFLKQWWPDAERRAETGFRTSNRVSADLGDIRNTPLLAWQLKCIDNLSDREIDNILNETQDQAVAAGADFGIFVQRRPGKSDPGKWWAYLRVSDLAYLATMPIGVVRLGGLDAHVRLLLTDVVALLVRAGYGDAPR